MKLDCMAFILYEYHDVCVRACARFIHFTFLSSIILAGRNKLSCIFCCLPERKFSLIKFIGINKILMSSLL